MDNLALCFFERILNQEYPKDILFVHKDQYDYLVYFELAICYYWIGDYLKAQQCAYKVKSTNNVPSSILKQNDLNLEYINNKLVLSDSISSLNLEYHAST
jgi:hypothetical protein